MNEKLEQAKKGTKLIAIDECKMYENDENALIIGKCYTVNSANSLYITIESEIDEIHQFYRTELNEFFKVSPILKEPNVLQEILDKIREKIYYADKDYRQEKQIVDFKDIEDIFSNYLNKINMITKKYHFSISTNKVGSETYDEVELEFDDDLTEEEIENIVCKIYTDWLFENNYGGFNEINNNG